MKQSSTENLVTSFCCLLLLSPIIVRTTAKNLILPQKHRHRHGRHMPVHRKIRPGPDHSLITTAMPSGSSKGKSAARNQLETHWSLRCPHVSDSDNQDVGISVVWMHDSAIVLKVENGRRTIGGRLSTQTVLQRDNNGKTFLTVTMHDGRHRFTYNELTGDFDMQIFGHIFDEDFGRWQCDVTVARPNGYVETLTSRSLIQANDMMITTFSRNNPDTVTMSRQSENSHTGDDIVFNRPQISGDPLVKSSRKSNINEDYNNNNNNINNNDINNINFNIRPGRNAANHANRAVRGFGFGGLLVLFATLCNHFTFVFIFSCGVLIPLLLLFV